MNVDNVLWMLSNNPSDMHITNKQDVPRTIRGYYATEDEDGAVVLNKDAYNSDRKLLSEIFAQTIWADNTNLPDDVTSISMNNTGGTQITRSNGESEVYSIYNPDDEDTLKEYGIWFALRGWAGESNDTQAEELSAYAKSNADADNKNTLKDLVYAAVDEGFENESRL